MPSSKALTIAIDFDNTFTADPQLWGAFMSQCKSANHRVICVTARLPTQENLELIGEAFAEQGFDPTIYFTALGSKLDYMEKQGVKVDIWIDDDPLTLVRGH